MNKGRWGEGEQEVRTHTTKSGAGVVGLEICERRSRVREKSVIDDTIGSQKLPERRMCNQPTRRPPTAKPTLVGISIAPAAAGSHPRTAMA
jgi:hypothetical protein